MPPVTPPELEPEAKLDESVLLERYELRMMVELGMPLAAARVLHEGRHSWHEVADLVEAGCSPALAFAILD